MLNKKEDSQEQFWRYWIQVRRENYLDYWLSEIFPNLDSQEKHRIDNLYYFLNRKDFYSEMIFPINDSWMDRCISDTEQPSFDDFLYKNNHKEKYRNRY